MKIVWSLLWACTLSSTTVAYAKPKPALQTIKEVERRSQPSSGDCKSNADCSYHGQCSASFECVCEVGFTGRDCSYHQKRQSTAFFLHFLLGWSVGAGDLYLNEVRWAAVRMSFFWAGNLFLGTTAYLRNKPERQKQFLFSVCSAVSFHAMNFLWWLFDVAVFAHDDLRDSEGQTLSNW